jgi:TolA-binding protein
MPGVSPGSVRGVLALVLALGGAAAALAQVSPDQQADMLLDSARKAVGEKNYAVAVSRFREFLTKFGNHKQVPAARYGLAQSLIDGPEKDYAGALEQLQALAGSKDLPEHPFVLWYLGLAQRGLGLRELDQAAAKPADAARLRASAQLRFEEASKQFAAAGAAFLARVKPPTDAKELPADLEWSARARCDQAEMLLRLLRAKEAQAAVEPFLKDAALARSRYRGLGLYDHGFASFLLKDYLTAGRSLNQLGPFTDPVYGTHARYLLARIHHLAEEHAEAAGHYEGVVAEFDRQRKAAVEALKRPELKNDPEEKVRLDRLVKGPLPDHVARANFYLALLQYEAGRFAEALARFTVFVQQQPASPLAAEARLRQGFCQVQLKQFAAALQTLQPLVDKEPAVSDRAVLWIARALAGGADPAKPPAYEQTLKTALDSLRKAADRLGPLARSDPEAKQLRGEMLLEQGDIQQQAKQYKEAAATYERMLKEEILPSRNEELLQRQATALHLAGAYGESDKVCAQFQQRFPKSPLLPALLFRHAENAYFAALAAEKDSHLPDRTKAFARLNDEVIRRYLAVVELFPEFVYANLARHGLGMTYYRKGDLEKAKEVLEAIPVADRTGELALVPYILADILIRLAPTKADDALAAGRVEENLKVATELLSAFLASQGTSPQAPDALLKLGHCLQRRAALLAEPKDRIKGFAEARLVFDRLVKQFPRHELYPQGMLERAKCLAQQGNPNGAIGELRGFVTDPLRQSAIAPLGVLQLATLLRGQNKAGEAADHLAQCRQLHEANFLKDPTRAGLVPLLQYHHGVALQEAGKRAEARAVFTGVIKLSPDCPEASEAALRWGQSLKEDGLQKLGEARKRLAAPNLKPEESAAANQLLDDGLKDVRESVQYLEGKAEQLKLKLPEAEIRARMCYDAAWGARTLADAEVAVVRTKIQQEQWQKLQEGIKKKTPAGQPVPKVPPPDMLLTAVPLQAAERKARTLYQALIAAFPDLPLATDARFELAELLADRGDHDPAIKLLRETLDREPPPELTDKVRIRLGACLAAKGDHKAALTQFQIVARNPKGALVAQGYYRVGESLMHLSDWQGAVKQLSVFRDQPPFQNVAGLTDRALLRLGHAYAPLKQWPQSRQAHEQVVARFGSGPWALEARYGIGWAWQNEKQYDHAVNAYAQVTANTFTELGAKAQLQIGLCRLEQKKYDEAARALLVVPSTYDYPELSAAALCEAARALVELKQREQAEKLLRRVIKEHSDSKWAEVAKERLDQGKDK